MQFKHLLILISFVSIITACELENRPESQGYVEGRYTYIMSSVTGTLTELRVAKGDQVKPGDFLFRLDLKPELDNYEAAKASFAEAQSARTATAARVTFAKLTFERNRTLVPKGAIQIAELDRAKSEYAALTAELNRATAAMQSSLEKLKAAKWALDQKTGYAPVAGMVFDTFYRKGEFTDAKSPILSILAPSDIKIVFYIPQPHLGRIHINGAIKGVCDGCPRIFRGKISFISPTAEYTPPLIYSNQTNEKLIFRIEAIIPANDAIKLHPGQPVKVIYG